jgi:H+-transporting ATPase
MLIKKTEIVLFLAIGLGLTGHAVMTPVLMVLLLVTNDFLSMSLTTDRASPAPGPSVWRMPSITAAAVLLAVCKLFFSTAILAFGAFALRLHAAELQALTFVALVFGNQAVLYALRERRHMWASRPGFWVVASSVLDIGIVTTLALAGFLMAPLSLQLLATVFVAAVALALALDQIKLPVMSAFKIT